MITITDRWGNETSNPSKEQLNKTLNDVFLDNTLPEISITDGYYHLDINKNGWVNLDDDCSQYYMKNITEDKIRELWKDFSSDNVDYVLAET